MDQQELAEWHKLAQAVIAGSQKQFEAAPPNDAYRMLAVVSFDGACPIVHPKRWLKKSLGWARKEALLHPNSAIAELGLNADYGFMVKVLHTESYGFLATWANRYPNNHQYDFSRPVLHYAERQPR